eukprot:TRINITY_DN2850_c0_g2_i2.p1 TRINITY_DN2850_c0_g2~~TRINITY_DN2850_c0_g2_i2.p1  ORF type:complete len:258 (-),score=72.85 TRINITY_DN2850_c0_g2_i2:58-831(-)
MSEIEVLKEQNEELKEQNASYKLALGKCGEREFHLQNQINSLKEQAKPTKSAREIELEAQVAQLLKEKKDAQEEIQLANDARVIASDPSGVFDYLQEDINSGRDFKEQVGLVISCSESIVESIAENDENDEPFAEVKNINGESIMGHLEEFLENAQEFEGERGLWLLTAVMESTLCVESVICNCIHGAVEYEDYFVDELSSKIDEAAMELLKSIQLEVSLDVLEYLANEFSGPITSKFASSLIEEPRKKMKCETTRR